MKKTVLALAAAAALGVTAIAPDQAEARGRGGAIAAGVIGGIALGAIAGSAMAGPHYYHAPAPRYYAPAPVYYGPRCHWQRQRVFDGYGWRVQRVRVCY